MPIAWPSDPHLERSQRSTRCRMTELVDPRLETRRMGLGQLERKVMDTLWDAPDQSLSGREVADQIPDRAYTTVLTILERLRRKKLVKRSTDGKVHTFSAAATRESYTASLMLEPLGSAQDRNAVLVRFAKTVSPTEAKILREALDASRKRRLVNLYVAATAPYPFGRSAAGPAQYRHGACAVGRPRTACRGGRLAGDRSRAALLAGIGQRALRRRRALPQRHSSEGWVRSATASSVAVHWRGLGYSMRSASRSQPIWRSSSAACSELSRCAQ